MSFSKSTGPRTGDDGVDFEKINQSYQAGQHVGRDLASSLFKRPSAFDPSSMTNLRASKHEFSRYWVLAAAAARSNN